MLFIPIFGRGKVEMPEENVQVDEEKVEKRQKRRHRAGRKLQESSVYKNLCCWVCNSRYTNDSVKVPSDIVGEWIERRERARKVGKRAAPVVFGKCRDCISLEKVNKLTKSLTAPLVEHVLKEQMQELEKLFSVEEPKEQKPKEIPKEKTPKENKRKEDTRVFFLDEDLGFDLYYKAKEEEILLFLDL